MTPRPTLRAAEALRAALAAGRWPVLSRLPGEHHLANEFGVARGTIRRALTNLADQGLLIRRPHAGYVIAAEDNEGDGGLLANAVILVSEMMNGDFPFAEEYPAATLIGAQRRAAQKGVHLLLINRDNWDLATQRNMAGRRPTAVIMCDIIGDGRNDLETTLTLFEGAGIPLISHADPADLTVGDCTAADQTQGGRLLVEHSRQRQRLHPLLLGTPSDTLPWWRRRRDAILMAWQAAGVTGRTIPIEIEDRSEQRHAGNFNRRMRIYASYLAEELAAGRRPDVLFVSSDSDVAPVTAACRLVGLDPARDLDVLGFDGYWSRTWEREFEPLAPAATIRANHLLVGERLLDLAIRADRAATPRQAQCVAVELVGRT